MRCFGNLMHIVSLKVKLEGERHKSHKVREWKIT